MFKNSVDFCYDIKSEMCELSSRARAFSVEALIGVKSQNTEETGKKIRL